MSRIYYAFCSGNDFNVTVAEGNDKEAEWRRKMGSGILDGIEYSLGELVQIDADPIFFH